jgi:hypothetical protein
MKLLAVMSARAIWLVKVSRLNPRGRSLMPAVIGLAERYKFSKVPQLTTLTVRPLDLRFENGVFEGADGGPIAINLSIYDDGLIADTRASTDESDRFLEDALTWASDEHGLPGHAELGVERLYSSELMIDIDLTANVFNRRFSAFAEKLQRGISNNPGTPMEFIALSFGPDPAKTQRAAPFRIERLQNTSFGKREYYSSAPVSTSEHVGLLEEMERASS